MPMRLKLVPSRTSFDFFGWSRVTTSLSLAGLLASAALFLVLGLNYGIDFRGGTTIRTQSTVQLNIRDYRTALSQLDLGDVSITEVRDPAADLAGK